MIFIVKKGLLHAEAHENDLVCFQILTNTWKMFNLNDDLCPGRGEPRCREGIHWWSAEVLRRRNFFLNHSIHWSSSSLQNTLIIHVASLPLYRIHWCNWFRLTGMVYLCNAAWILPEAFQFDMGQLAFGSDWQILSRDMLIYGHVNVVSVNWV